jgi:competence protein ComEA
MKQTFFYWMKSYLGFSRKESHGFILLIPFLILLGLVPNAIGYFKNLRAETTFLQYQNRLDSLREAGIFLEISPLPTFNPQDTAKSKRNQKQIDNLNRISFAEVDSITLQIVPGIGQATAGRIIKYRENLGGFHSRSQLQEVYGMKEETVSAVWDFFDFEAIIFRKINLNVATLEELAAHPYISYGEAKVLLAFRNQHGNFNSAEDLMKVKIFKVEWIEKIRPYLNFE